MANISINCNRVLAASDYCNSSKNYINSAKNGVNNANYTVDGAIKARANIGGRLNSIINNLNDINGRINSIQSTCNNAANMYAATDSRLKNQVTKINTNTVAKFK